MIRMQLYRWCIYNEAAFIEAGSRPLLLYFMLTCTIITLPTSAPAPVKECRISRRLAATPNARREKKIVLCLCQNHGNNVRRGEKSHKGREREVGAVSGAYQDALGKQGLELSQGIYYTTELSALFGSKGMSLIQKHSLLDSFWGFH